MVRIDVPAPRRETPAVAEPVIGNEPDRDQKQHGDGDGEPEQRVDPVLFPGGSSGDSILMKNTGS
jgi:hypothetical protein